MNDFFSQIPKDLPPWVWIILVIIMCLTIYSIAKNSLGNKKQSNSISGTTIKKSKVTQKNIDNNEES